LKNEKFWVALYLGIFITEVICVHFFIFMYAFTSNQNWYFYAFIMFIILIFTALFLPILNRIFHRKDVVEEKGHAKEKMKKSSLIFHILLIIGTFFYLAFFMGIIFLTLFPPEEKLGPHSPEIVVLNNTLGLATIILLIGIIGIFIQDFIWPTKKEPI